MPEQLSSQEKAALDELIEKVRADANFITVIARATPVVTRATPGIARVTANITPAIVGAQASALKGELDTAEVRLLVGKASANDLIEIRKKLVEGH